MLQSNTNRIQTKKPHHHHHRQTPNHHSQPNPVNHRIHHRQHQTTIHHRIQSNPATTSQTPTNLAVDDAILICIPIAVNRKPQIDDPKLISQNRNQQKPPPPKLKVERRERDKWERQRSFCSPAAKEERERERERERENGVGFRERSVKMGRILFYIWYFCNFWKNWEQKCLFQTCPMHGTSLADLFGWDKFLGFLSHLVPSCPMLRTRQTRDKRKLSRPVPSCPVYQTHP